MRAGRAVGVVTSLLFAGAIWGLGEYVYAKYRMMHDEPPAPMPFASATTASVSLPAELTVALPALEDLSAIIERPMFSQSRRPVEVAVEAPQSAAAPVLDLDIVGIVIWHAQRFALVRSKKDNKVIKIDEGGAVAGWVAIGIGPEHVLFRNGDIEKELHLTYNNR